ncbi:hypothetical protein IPA_00155 [Ignicoccus pacificus DSM 13166]|uniref:Uncharacterized protein n=1 Tax=Ignicoccus pacificus DSM 13166 TaxID=940294 RepID=A0A977KBR5_9CREN|nr:hypothetical protein IPA_00155 [Ignicoccus pacificus DSM 13166]
MLVPVKCGLNDKGRKVMLSSALGTAVATLLFPWLDPLIAGSALISATALQTIACSKSKRAKVEREVRVSKDTVFVRVRGPKGAKLIDVVTSPPSKGSLKGIGVVEYQIDLSVNPFVYWNGIMIEVERGACKCWGYGELRELVSSWSIEGLGLAEIVEEEGGFQAVPEVVGTREYRPGDETRLIIWKTLYSPGGLRVKELKKVKEITRLSKGIRVYSADPGPWYDNPCFKELFNSIVTYLEKLGLKKVEGEADVRVVGPFAKVEKASVYLLLNPLACIPPLETEFDALELIRKKVEKEFKSFEASLKERGDVRAVPWSTPPRYRL